MMNSLMFSGGFCGNDHQRLIQKRRSHESLRPSLVEDKDTYKARALKRFIEHSLSGYTIAVEQGAETSEAQKAKRYNKDWERILNILG